jgi:hypothetical protein
VVNAWTWRPTLGLLLAANVVNRERGELLGVHGVGAAVDAELADRFADAIDRRLREPAMRPGQRMLADGSLTSAPRKAVVFSPTLPTEPVDANDLYSTTYEWLVSFKDFCRQSGGFKVS